MQTINSLLRNTTFNIITNLLNRLSNALLLILIVREIAVGAAGVYDLGIAYFLIASRFAFWGLGQILMRDVGANPRQVDRYFSNFLYVRVALAMAMILLAVSFISLANYETSSQLVLLVMLLSVLPENINELCVSVFAAFESAHLSSIGSLLNATIKLGVGILLVKSGYGLLSIAVVLLAGNLSAMAVSLTLVRRRYVSAWHRPDFVFIRQQLRVASPFIFIGVFYITDNRLDKVLLSFLSDAEAIGLYGAATAIILALAMVPEAYRIAILPLMSRYRHESQSLFQPLYEHSYKFMLVIGMALVVSVPLLSDEIVHLVYRRDMPETVVALRIMALALGFIFVNALNTRLLLVNDKHHLTALFFLVAAIVNTAMNLWLIPQFGVVGAAIGRAISISLRFALVSWVAMHLVPKTGLAAYGWRLLLSLAAMGGAIWQLAPLGIWVQIAVGGLVYLAMLLVTGTISADERHMLRDYALSRISRQPRPAE